MAKEINDSDFSKEVIQNQGIVFVDFWAPWCDPCLMMASTFEKMSKEDPNVKFCKLNTQENMLKAGEFNITGIPCIVIFKNGVEVDRLVGVQPEQVFEEIVKKYA